MDHADRIPIDLGYGVTAASEQTGPRTIQKTDGTLVIDILVPQPCAPPNDGEIVVCGPAEVEAQQRLGDSPPPEKSAAEKFGEALHAKIGPLELGSIDKGDGTRAFGARVRF